MRNQLICSIVCICSTLTACSDGQHPTDAFPSTTIAPETAAVYTNENLPRWEDWLSDTAVTPLTQPLLAEVLDGLEVDGLYLAKGEQANRFDAIGTVGVCGAILTEVLPPVNDRFTIVILTPSDASPALRFRKENTTVKEANVFIRNNSSAC